MDYYRDMGKLLQFYDNADHQIICRLTKELIEKGLLYNYKRASPLYANRVPGKLHVKTAPRPGSLLIVNVPS